MDYWKAGHSLQNGKYIIEEVLGSGGFGVTYRAKDAQKGQQVAIKTLSAAIQAEPNFNEYQQRFIQEAFRLAKCPHPHIVRVDDVFSEGELWCMVMECIDGGDLQEYVGDRSILSESEALQYIQQVGEALSYLHQQELLHRDVKPANILLRRKTKEAVLIDFGLARDFIEGKTLTHTNVKTERFAPPEQYKEKATRGAFTDVYALSATLYYLLTNELPFPSDIRQQGIPLISPQKLNSRISDRVNEAILKGMELDYQDRPQSVKEWLGLLQKQPSSGVKLVSAVGMDLQDVTRASRSRKMERSRRGNKTGNVKSGKERRGSVVRCREY